MLACFPFLYVVGLVLPAAAACFCFFCFFFRSLASWKEEEKEEEEEEETPPSLHSQVVCNGIIIAKGQFPVNERTNEADVRTELANP